MQNIEDLIKQFEGCSLRAYQDLGGRWTIGYGSTRAVSPGMVITPQQAEDRLKSDLSNVQLVLKSLIKVPMKDNQLNACISLAYNIGLANFARSTLLKKLNVENYQGASQEFARWAHVGGIYSPGLEKRRLTERNIFSS